MRGSLRSTSAWPVDTSGGTNTYIPKFTDLDTIENSFAHINGAYFQIDGMLELYYHTPLIYLYETDQSKAWYIGTSSSEFNIWENTTFFTNKRLTIDPGGNVGIATAAPSYKLDVNGTFRATSIRSESNGRLIGGNSNNSIYSYAYYASILGGTSNTINDADYAFIGAGGNNTIANSAFNSGIVCGVFNSITTGAEHSFIGGGLSNEVSADMATIGGGWDNTASGIYCTVGGGEDNTASDIYATVGGGEDNVASGEYSTIPGGSDNRARYNYTFAAGRRADANHNGSFVWADSTDAAFVSSTTNQFKVRASGGAWFSEEVSALCFDDRPGECGRSMGSYPPDLETAYESVLSMQRTANDTSQLDYSSLASFIYSEGPDGEPQRNLSATVSAQNEVIKHLIVRITQLEQICAR